MQPRAAIAGLGAGITTFLVVAVIVIELLDFEFSGIPGLPVGLLAGIAVLALVIARYEAVSAIQRAAIDRVSGFGIGAILILALEYVHLLELATDTTVGVGFLIGGLAGIASWVMD